MIKISCLIALLLGISGFVHAQEAKLHLRDFSSQTVASFKVYGECNLCQKRILQAVELKGVRSAFWDKEDQVLTVEYDGKVINDGKIQVAIAKAGHDTEKFRTSDAVYERLPECCHYTRRSAGEQGVNRWPEKNV